MIGGSVILIFSIAILALQGWRLLDEREAARAWQALRQHAQYPRTVFDPSAVEDLPEPARRYFRFTIRPGTVLSRVAEIRMTGEIGLGSKDKPNYLPMRAHQILALPFGFVWKVEAGRGLLRFSGPTDSAAQSPGRASGCSSSFRLSEPAAKTICLPRSGASQPRPRSGRRHRCCRARMWYGKPYLTIGQRPSSPMVA